MAWILVALVALVLSAAYHLQLDFAGVVAVETVTSLLDQEIQGSIEIGELHNVSYEKVVASAVVIRDPDGREVIRADRVAAWPNWGALMRGVIYVDKVRLRGGMVTLIPSGTEDSPSVSIAETFLPVHPSDDPPDPNPIRIVINDIVVDELTTRGSVPGFEGLRVEEMRVSGRVDVAGDARVYVYDGRAVVTGPYEGRTPIDEISGTVHSDLTADGIRFWARGHRGDDRFRALFRLWQVEIPDGETQTHMDLRVALDPVRMSTLAEMQVAPGLENLTGTFRGFGRLAGEVSDLRLTAEVTSEAGQVYGTGHLPSDGPLVFTARTLGPLRADLLVPVAPNIRVAGSARVTIERGEGEEPTIRVHAEPGPFTLDEIAIPAAVIEARILDESIAVDSAVAEVADGRVTTDGTVGFDGSLDLHVVARLPEISREPNVRHFAPEARGSLDAELTLRADAELANLRADGRVSMRNVRYGASLSAGALTVRGHASGEPPAPVLRLTGEASGLHLGELSFGTATLGVRGGPGGYTLEARASDPQSHTRVAIDGRATSREGQLTLDTTQLVLDLGDGAPWHGQAGITMRTGQSVDVRTLHLERDDEAIAASGVYRFNGPDAFDVTVTNADLAQLERFAPQQLAGIAGRADAHLVVTGDVDTRPQGTLSASVRGGRFRGVDGVEVRAELALEGETLATDVRVDLGEDGRLSTRGDVQLSAASLRDPSRIVEDADLSALTVQADDLSLGPILALAGTDAAVAGRITTDVMLGGSPGHPEVRDAVIVLDHVGPEDWDPLRLKARVSYTSDRVRASRVWVANEGGELLNGSADLPLSLQDPPTDLRSFWRSLNASTWSADVRLPPRRLDSWPRPLRDRMPPGILVAAQVRANGDASGPHATYSALARVVEIADEEARCSAELDPHVTLEGRLDGAVATGSVLGYTGTSRAVVEGSLIANLPLDAWIDEGDVRDFPGTEVRLRLLGAEMSAIPYACTYGSGPISGTVTAKDILTDNPIFGAVVEMPHLQVWEQAGDHGTARLTEAFRVHARAGSSPERDALTACVILGLAGETATPGEQCREVERAGPGELISRLRVPVTWTGGQLAPTLVEDATLSSWSDFHDVHVAPVVGFIPGVVAGDAVITGQITAEGPWEGMQMNGDLDVSNGHVQIEGLGQHLHGIAGRIELSGDEAVFPADHPLRASDSGGTALAQGRIGFEGLFPRTVDLSVSADAFPIRREGMVLAWLTGGATVGGTIADESTTTTIRTSDFSIRLPEQTAATLQPLEPHPEVLVVGTERVVGGVRPDAYAVHVRINATDPFLVRRNDFTVWVAADLSATYEDPELRIGGQAQIIRGTFEIFGKRFELNEGVIQFGEPGFDGTPMESAALDPQVRVVAVYAIPGRSGDTVTVEVTGSLTNPTVTFRSTITNDQAEIISLLVAGDRSQSGNSSQAAEEQATSFLAGLTAGILTLGLRQELGDVIPVLAIESQGLGGTRIRAGFTADDLIPDFMRDVILGAYVEGFFTAAAEGTNAAGGSSGNGGVGGGVTIEFTFPDDLLLRGTYVPVDNGSLDLVFEP
ncbi:MAG: translocation/assembly module TamB domain-containing protein [Sandaracinaceae bacterium]|nr:translocation/assembly module TamB domain-containing protein [Sandaracinaceae bacterium]